MVSGWADGRKNIFMVGDVKQSIYRFRLARPELFMEKYRTYSLEDSREQRIDLHRNFRSRPQVLESVNYIFRRIMGEDLGGIAYDSKQRPLSGGFFSGRWKRGIQENRNPSGGKGRRGAGRRKRGTDRSGTGSPGCGLGDQQDRGKGRDTGQGIRTVPEGGIRGHCDPSAHCQRMGGNIFTGSGVQRDSGVYCIPDRIFFRRGGGDCPELSESLRQSPSGYSPGRSTPFSYRRMHFPGTGNDTGEVSGRPFFMRASALMWRTGRWYFSPRRMKRKKLKAKLRDFLERLQKVRDMAPYTPVHQLILYILEETGYEEYARALPGGSQRGANLHMLVEKAMDYEKTSYRGLFNFVRYIESLQKYEVDFGEVNLSGAGSGSVQIMTVHKSKGLEFPVVFAAGMGKQFNFQDINARLLLHPDLGFGADAVFAKKRLIVPHTAETDDPPGAEKRKSGRGAAGTLCGSYPGERETLHYRNSWKNRKADALSCPLPRTGGSAAPAGRAGSGTEFLVIYSACSFRTQRHDIALSGKRDRGGGEGLRGRGSRVRGEKDHRVRSYSGRDCQPL